MLSGEQRRAAGHVVLVAKDGLDETDRGVGNGVLGALLAGVRDVAAMTSLGLALGLVEAEALGLLSGEVGEGLAAKANAGHGSELGRAVLTEHIGVDGVLIETNALGDGVAQTAGVQSGAGAHDALGVAAGEAPNLGADDVAGVGDGDPDAVEAGVGNAGDEGAGDLGGDEEFTVAVLGGGGDVTGGVDDDVAAGELLVLGTTGDDLSVAGIERQGVREVLGLTRQLLLVDVTEIELVRKTLHEKGVRDVRAHVTLTNDADLADVCHVVSFRREHSCSRT